MINYLPRQRWSTKEQILFIKRLSFLIGAGLPLLDSLELIRKQNFSRRHSVIFDALVEDVANGNYLSKSLSRFPKVFGQFAINIVRVGEESGILSQNLNYLAAELKKKQQLRRKVASALVYPVIITVATLLIAAFLMIYLFPKIIPIFTSLRLDLPWSTKVLIAISGFLQNWGLAALGGLIVIVAIFVVVVKKNRRVKKLCATSLLKLPLVGQMITGYNLANSGRTISLLLQSGLTLTAALKIAAATCENIIFQQVWQEWEQKASRGECLALNQNELTILPPTFRQLVYVGEKSGNLDRTLMYLSELYEQELDDITKDLSALIEPSLMIFMGLLIGFVAISIITPIYSLTQNLHG